MKLLVFDANSVVNRAFYGVRPLSTSSGFPTNALFGYVNIFLRFLEEQKPDYLCAVFDVHAPTFRHRADSRYKATRHPMPEDLAVQMPVLKEILAAMNIPVLELAGYEADDIIGTLSAQCEHQQVDCVIVTGDKDDLQLIGPHTTVSLVSTRMGQTTTKLMDQAALQEEYGLTPAQMIDLKALMGDSSDNIPGVAGVGEKTALSLIGHFGTLDHLYANLEDSFLKPGVRDKLAAGREEAYLSRFLGTIFREVPLQSTIADYQIKPIDTQALYAVFRRLEFNKLIERFSLSASSPTAAPAKEQQISPLCVADLPQGAVACLWQDAGLAVLCSETVRCCAADDPALPTILEALFISNRIVVTHDYKALLHRLAQAGLPPADCSFDTMLAAYVLDPAAAGYTMHALCAQQLSQTLPEEPLAALCAACAALPLLQDKQEQALTETNQDTLYRTIELPLAAVLFEMEQAGMEVQPQELSAFGEELRVREQQVAEEIYQLAGTELNLNSPKQLGQVLFETLALPVVKKTKTGYSTDNDVLQKLMPYHPIVALVMEYRKLSKLRSTYVDALLGLIDPKTNRIHTTFHQTVAQTGRLSSSDPNLQNIPIRTELGSQIRRVFRAAPEHILVDADYSQIELRVLAHMAQDPTMIEAFKTGTDIHTLTASSAFRIPLDQVTHSQRSAAKAVNFGIVYGIGEFSLADDLHISRKQARTYIDSYFDTYPGIRRYMDETIAAAQRDGYVTTLFGRRRYLPELSSSNYNIREFGKRCAMNTPIQGTAADIIKLAMLRIREALKAQGLKAHLVLQVHDEVIVEAPLAEREQVEHLVKEQMEQVYPLLVPLTADVHSAENWLDAK